VAEVTTRREVPSREELDLSNYMLGSFVPAAKVAGGADA
jgi:hypothetical protein